MTTPGARDLLYTWNDVAAGADPLARVKIEDDSLRDGLQGAFVRKPDLAQKQALLELSAAVGTQAAMLGFPASSPLEREECAALVSFLTERELPVVPRFLARARPADVEPIIELHHGARRDVWADFFMGCSPLRRAVEGWEIPDQLDRIRTTGERLRRSGTPFGVSLEDASRTPPGELREYIGAALDCGARVLTLCDTVGDCTPEGAARLTRFALEAIAARGAAVEVWWHGHNDRGLALANALASAGAGASTISGAFLGIGERAGNTALEQVVTFLAQGGNPHYRVEALEPYCRRLAEATGTAIPPNAPLIGRQAFATATGTHSAALLKARSRGGDWEDHVFSSVPAGLLGRAQDISIGPGSGLSNALHALAGLQLRADDQIARRLLHHAKSGDHSLTADEIRRWYAAEGVEQGPG